MTKLERQVQSEIMKYVRSWWWVTAPLWEVFPVVLVVVVLVAIAQVVFKK